MSEAAYNLLANLFSKLLHGRGIPQLEYFNGTPEKRKILETRGDFCMDLARYNVPIT